MSNSNSNSSALPMPDSDGFVAPPMTPVVINLEDESGPDTPIKRKVIYYWSIG